MKNIILVSFALIFLVSCTLTPEKSTNPDTLKTSETKVESTMMMDDTKNMEDAMMSGSLERAIIDDKTMSGTDMMKKDQSDISKPTGYISYDEAKMMEALASGQRVVLFFHATWCPSCKALDKTLSDDTVPSDAIIFKVDYDTSTDLKKKYRVVAQHTTVVLNADGTEKSKKLGARNIMEILN